MIHLLATILSDDIALANNILLIIAGQSNAVGWTTGAPSDPNLNGDITGARIYTGTQWQQLNYPSNNEGNAGHAVELQAGYQGAINTNKTIDIIKSAEASTGLADDWLPPSGTNYTAMTAKVNAGITGLQYSKIIFYWNQGEEDALLLADANAYQANLENLIDSVRSDISQEIIFLCTRLRTDIGRTYASNVRAAQEAAVAFKSDAYTINQDDLTKLDTLHFDSDSQNTLADRVLTYF